MFFFLLSSLILLLCSVDNEVQERKMFLFVSNFKIFVMYQIVKYNNVCIVICKASKEAEN